MTPASEVERVLRRFRDLGFWAYDKARVSHYDVLLLQPDRLGVSVAEWTWVRTGRHLLTGLARRFQSAPR